jgi:YVTN family beta-propeller protein
VNIWSGGFSNDVVKVNASTGTIVNSYTVGTAGSIPYGMVFDGQYIWVANYNSPSSVSSVLATTGAVATYPLPTCSLAQGMAFDGSHIWVSCFGSHSVLELSTTGNVIATVQVGNFPAGLAFDGTNIWVANSFDNTVSQINITTRAVLTVTANVTPWAVAFDTKYIWVTSAASSNCTVVKLQPSTAVLVGSYPAPCSGDGIAFDGGNIWIANTNGTISKF